MSLDIASGPLDLVKFDLEVPSHEQKRGDSLELPVPAGGGHVSGGEVDGEPQGGRAHLLLALPCSIVARSEPTTCTGGPVADMPAATAFWWSSARPRCASRRGRIGGGGGACGRGYRGLEERERLWLELTGGHGDGANSRASTERRRSERGHRVRAGRSRECSARFWRCREQGSAWKWRWGACPCMNATEPATCRPLGIYPSTWRATK